MSTAAALPREIATPCTFDTYGQAIAWLINHPEHRECEVVIGGQRLTVRQQSA